MDLSALLFVALAVAWAVYLVPKALKHHDSVQRSRSVERFSHRMRVLARREPTSSRDARLVVTPGRAPSQPLIETKGRAPVVATVAARRAAANRAARRRRTVLSLILGVLVVVAALALAGLFSGWWVAAPTGVLAAWLVACRLMVRSERARPVARPSATQREVAPEAESDVVSDGEPTQAHPVVTAEISDSSVTMSVIEVELTHDDPSRWDMVPVTLPTYVTKPAAARRTVQTIDLDSTGVWTSGHSEAESALARTAQEIKRAEAQAEQDAEQRRAVGH